MDEIYTIVLVRKAGAPSYNKQLRDEGFLDEGDVLTVLLYPLAADVTVPGSHTWLIHTWNQVIAEANRLRDVIFEGRNPNVNTPSPGCPLAYYRSDEPRTGASTTTAPIDGWTKALIFNSPDGLLRRPDALKEWDAGA